jgi:hypothetical protein
MATAQTGLTDFESTQHLRSSFRRATIGIVSAKGNDMAKKQAVKTTDPFGPDFTALAEQSFDEAISAVLERQKRKGQDSPCAVDGRLAVRKPDGRLVFKSDKSNG